MAQTKFAHWNVKGLNFIAVHKLFDELAEKLDLDHPVRMGVSRRIGITKAAHRLLRFYERGNRFVSGTARLRA